MYKSEFDKYLQSGKISNSFILFGESSFLIDAYTKKLSSVEDASILSFYYNEYDFKSAKAHLSQSSLFGGTNVLIIKNDKKVPKKELDTIIDLCDKSSENIFIFAYYGSDHKTYNKAFSKKSTMVVRFFHPDHNEAINILLNIVKTKHINMNRYSIEHLLNIQNGDIALACNEMDKFELYDKEITTKDIDHLVSGLAEISTDEFIKKVLLNKEFTDDLQNILDHGQDEIRLLTDFTSYLTQLYMFNIYMRVNGAPNALEILGYPAPKFVVDEKAALCLKLKPNSYYRLHKLLLESELKMKSSGIDKSAILLSTLIRVQKLID